MATREIDRVQSWFIRHHLASEIAKRWQLDGSDTRSHSRQILRWLNRVESRFDDLLAETEEGGRIAWDALRRELHLLPRPDNAWLSLTRTVEDSFPSRGWQPMQVERAVRLWRDFLYLEEDEVRPLQVPAGWLAAMEYLLQSLYFTGSTTQAEYGAWHGVSTSTVGLRYRTLVDTLDLQLWDHPARKQLFARRALALEGAGMSEGEFNRRLVEGEPVITQ